MQMGGGPCKYLAPVFTPMLPILLWPSHSRRGLVDGLAGSERLALVVNADKLSTVRF